MTTDKKHTACSSCVSQRHTRTIAHFHIFTVSCTVVGTHWAASGWIHGTRTRQTGAATGYTGWWDATGRWTGRRPSGTLQRQWERNTEGEGKRETVCYKFSNAVRDVHNTGLKKSRKKPLGWLVTMQTDLTGAHCHCVSTGCIEKMQRQRCMDVFRLDGFWNCDVSSLAGRLKLIVLTNKLASRGELINRPQL